ncbi:hypothetical protein BZA77DRAFT_303038 [Pyronema omphalodes]|nr:hypothetical protein BZA77DRAFT_303038 [Pyronema omphalodes]
MSFANLFNSAKRSIQTFRNDDVDGDTEDDSHITRALRTYYIESQRPYPDWLPAPPNQRSNSPALGPVASLRNAYGRRQQPASGPPGSNPTDLSSIFDGESAPAENRPGFGRNVSSASTTNQRPQLFPSESAPAVPTSSGTNGGGNLTAAQLRIRERLKGAARATTNSPPAQSPYAPPSSAPPRQAAPAHQGGGGMPWDAPGGGRQGLQSGPRYR